MNFFEQTDYRKLIRAVIRDRPEKGRGQLSRLAKHLGVNATLVSQVLSGAKDFTLEQGIASTEFFGMNALESEYVLLLVQRSRAGTPSLRAHFDAKLVEFRKKSLDLSQRLKKDKEFTDTEKAVFYSSWLYSAVRLSTSIGDGQTADDIAARFGITYAKAKEILEFLTRADLCRQEKQKYRMGVAQTHIDFKSPFRVQHVTNWHTKALQAADRLSEKEMQFSACVSVSRKAFEEVREKLVKAIADAATAIKAEEPEDLACFNVDWFWLR